MYTICKVCLSLSILISALIPLFVHGDGNSETSSATAQTKGQYHVSTEDVGSILDTKLPGKCFEQQVELDRAMEKGHNKEDTKQTSKREQKRNRKSGKVMDPKRKEMGIKEQGDKKQSEAAKVVDEKVNMAKETEQKEVKVDAKDKKEKEKRKGHKGNVVRPSIDPDRIAKTVNKAIKEDNARRTEENLKVHLDIEEFTEIQAGGASEGAQTVIHLALQVCGDRMPEMFILLKSAMMLSRVHLHFHVFVEEELQLQLGQEWDSWPLEERQQTKLDIRVLSFPPENAKKWKNLEGNKPCATQRIFLPDLLVELDAVLYVDTDIVFMRPPEDLWRLFHHFNDSHIAGLTREQEDGSFGWYNRFARGPYVFPIGVNSGVILMNLTRMRTANWVAEFTSYLTLYKSKLTWGDQDLINIFFHFKPELLFLFPCHWNFRSDHCSYGPLCPPAYEYGVNLVHGSRRVFHNDKNPTFKTIYNTFKEHKTGEGLNALAEQLKMNLAAADIQNKGCGRVSGFMTKQLQRQASLVIKAKQANDTRKCLAPGML